MIVGLDIGRAGVVAAALGEFPANPVRYFRQHRQEYIRIKANADGVEKLLAMKPTGFVMEPTGVWYAAFWSELAKSNGIPVYWVGHGDLAAYRGSYGFKNKRDDEDAFSLGLMYYDDRFIDSSGRKRFLTFESGSIAEIHELFLELEQIDKVKTSMVNQIRQRLAKEFPEICERETNINPKLGFSALWAWVAGVHTYGRIENEYSRSIAPAIGIKISRHTRDHALAICQLELREFKAELELVELLQIPEFRPYLRVFRKFGFGLRNQALLLSLVCPFEKFLVGGRPWIEWEEMPNGKKQKRHRSLRSFQAYLGLSYTLRQSGDKKEKMFGGSDLCRNHLYMWAVSCICVSPGLRPATEVGRALGDKYDELRKWDYRSGKRVAGADAVPGRDAITRILFRATALLFKELCRELVDTQIMTSDSPEAHLTSGYQSR